MDILLSQNPLSLGTGRLRLLRDGEHIIVHPKIGSNPVNFTVDEMMDAMRVVFGDHGIAVIVRQTENLTLPPELQDVDVGTCQLRSVTTEQTQLFNNRNNVGNNEIVIYFIHDTPGFDGCASHPPNRPGAIRWQKDAQVWVIVHEIGHNLGLRHPDQASCGPPPHQPSMTDRLMTCTWLGNVTNPPPDLIQSEVNTMVNSPLTTRCN